MSRELEISSTSALNLGTPRLSLKDRTLKILGTLGLYPQIFFSSMPFKIYEFDELVKGVSFSPSDRILDLGCGLGLQTLLLGQRGCEVVGLDVCASSIARAQRKAFLLKRRIRAEFHATPLLAAGFAAESFDKIFSFSVIEHIADYSVILSELHRIIKSGGEFIASVDALQGVSNPDLIARHRRDHQVEKYFTPEELRAALQAAGFREIDIYPIFTSAYAHRLFGQGVNSNFKFSLLSALWTWRRLSWAESRTRSKAGLFLVAKCRK